MRFVLITLFLCCTNSIYGQVALLDKVYDLVQNKDFLSAKTAIVSAEKHITTANDPRTFYLKAFIFKELLISAKDNIRDEYRNIALASISKCRSLDTNGDFNKHVTQLFEFITASLYNDAVDDYNGNSYEQAINKFKAYNALTNRQTNYTLDALYFIGASYNSIKVYDSAQFYYESAKSKNYNDPILHVDLAYLYIGQRNEEGALLTINQGLSLYPEFYDLQIAELNVFSTFGKINELEGRLNNFLAKNPNHLEVLLLAGSTYEKLASNDSTKVYIKKAENSYKRILTINETNSEANYNLGVLYYNQAVEIVNESSLETDIAELTEILELSTTLFEKSLPFLLRILNPKSPDSRILKALQAIYYNLNMKSELQYVNTLFKYVRDGQ